MESMFAELFQEKSEKVLEHFRSELRTIRTGRAHPSLVEDLPVLVTSYGGAKMRLMELAQISAPDPSLLLVQPFDPSVIADIEKAFQVANLGLSAVVDKTSIRLPIPPLTTERRQQMTKAVATKEEEAKVALRGVRTEVKELIEQQKDEAGVSEDDIKRQLAELQKDVDQATKSIEALSAEKQQELLQL